MIVGCGRGVGDLPLDPESKEVARGDGSGGARLLLFGIDGIGAGFDPIALSLRARG